MKITLSDKTNQIPRNKMGDPAFTELGYDVDLQTLIADAEEGDELPKTSVLAVFSPGEVVELVNRCLYQLEYQARSHTKRAAQQRALEAPVKEMLKQLYPGVSFAKATPEQISHCLKELQR